MQVGPQALCGHNGTAMSPLCQKSEFCDKKKVVGCIFFV